MSAKRMECVRLAGAFPRFLWLVTLYKAGASSTHSKRSASFAEKSCQPAYNM